jgi:hypothetical protein
MQHARCPVPPPSAWPIVLAILLLAPPLLFAAALLWPLSAPPLPEPGNSRVIVNARVVDVAARPANPPR